MASSYILMKVLWQQLEVVCVSTCVSNRFWTKNLSWIDRNTYGEVRISLLFTNLDELYNKNLLRNE